MKYLSYLIVGVLLAIFYNVSMGKNKNPRKLATNIVRSTVLLNLLTICFYKYLLRDSKIFSSKHYTVLFTVGYVLTALLFAFIYFFIKGLATNKLKITKYKEELTKGKLALRILYGVLFTIGSIFICFSFWFIDFFGELTPEQFLFNLKSPIKGTSSDMVNSLVSRPLFAVIVTTIFFIVFLCSKYEISLQMNGKQKKIFSRVAMRIISAVLAVSIFVGGISYSSVKLRFKEIYKAYYSNSTFIQDNYVDPRNAKLSFPEKKRNVIHIYLESIENSYLSKELGGHMKQNLMPELTELSKEGISFSDNDVFGGPHQTYGSSWSVAAMMNMDVGIPLKVPMGNNTYGKSGSFLPGAVSLGDILHAEGYNQTIMFGADADFGGLTTYFTSHGKYNIFDWKAAKEKKLIPEDYNVWWGFEDDKLYSYAKDELLRLAKEDKPFNFTMETADTHFPDGYLSMNVENKFDSQYANVIAYSTKEAVKFIRWIQEQDFYENTTLIVSGDHLSMDKHFFQNFDPNYRRSIYNLILNAPVTTTNTKNRQYAPFDFFPTILTSMGVKIEGDRLGLGTNLYSNEKTLVETLGVDKLNENLTSNSNFFNEEIINAKKNSEFDPKNVTTYK